jgi:hypothetical protein
LDLTADQRADVINVLRTAGFSKAWTLNRVDSYELILLVPEDEGDDSAISSTDYRQAQPLAGWSGRSVNVPAPSRLLRSAANFFADQVTGGGSGVKRGCARKRELESRFAQHFTACPRLPRRPVSASTNIHWRREVLVEVIHELDHPSVLST